ncbi:hypothetical protein EV360DRAFT_31752, partial [Lentinula raphanica]
MSDGKPQVFTASEYCKISLRDPSKLWRSKTVRALILPSLCYPMILGVPFLSHNSLVIDFAARTVIDKLSGFDLLNPSPVPLPSPSVPLPHPKLRRELRREEIVLTKRLVLTELKDHVCKYPERFKSEPVKPFIFDYAAAVRARIEVLEHVDKLDRLSSAIKDEFSDVFGEIPHFDELPKDITCKI